MGRKLTAVLLGLIVVAIVIALVVEQGRGPSFRAGDHASYDECIANIPSEWLRGSLEYTRAEAACQYAHR